MDLHRVAALLGLLALFGCGHTTNEALCADAKSVANACGYNPDYGYRFDPTRHADRDTLVVLTFSGGGTRAAALAYGTLQALNDLRDRSGASVLDQVDIISSVSGGSVTAGWYALMGKAGLASDADGSKDNKLVNFIYGDGMGAIAWRALNPVALTRYAVTSYQRSDVLANFFADKLYGDNTYDAVKRKYEDDRNEPFVILNATDLGHETRFPFTQNRFDLLCSDLSHLKLAYGVAASANFPIAFSPIGLKNYSLDCPAHRDETWARQGPPRWLEGYAQYEAHDPAGAGVPAPRSDGLAALRAARETQDYIKPGPDDTVLHLIDGGVVDNLGVQSTLALEDEAECAPGLYQRLKTPRPKAYEKIRRILYIVVNARSRSPAGIDNTVSPPDLITSTQRVIDTPIDNTILGVQNYLTAELQAIATPPRDGGQPFVPDEHSPKSSCWTKFHYASRQNLSERPQPPIEARIVTIDFEEIPDKPCRDSYWQIGTSWTLGKDDVDDLIKLPRVILARSSELHQFYGKSVALDAAKFPRDFASVCAARDRSATGLSGVDGRRPAR
jgi:NTE family protein